MRKKCILIVLGFLLSLGLPAQGVKSYALHQKNAYHSHYRIIKRSIFKKEILPLIDKNK